MLLKSLIALEICYKALQSFSADKIHILGRKKSKLFESMQFHVIIKSYFLVKVFCRSSLSFKLLNKTDLDWQNHSLGTHVTSILLIVS